LAQHARFFARRRSGMQLAALPCMKSHSPPLSSPPRWHWALLLAVLALAAPAQAIDIDLAEIVRNPVVGNYKGYAEFKMANYANARTIWEALAARGNPEAHFNLGILDEDGLGGAADMARAREHYEQSALGGSSKAQYRLGLLYTTGGKLARDPSLASKWLAMAAAQGDRDAQALLGQAASSQDEQDFLDAERYRAEGSDAQAVAVWRRLVGRGHARARTRLAWMLESGTGIERNLAEAAALFRLSAQDGEPEAQYALSIMLRTGKGQATDLAEAEQWLQRASAQGHQGAKAALQR